MDERLLKLKRLTGAMATRKRAYELRMAQINSRIAALEHEGRDLTAAANSLSEPFPGANLHYIKRLESLGKQLAARKVELNQLSLLHLKAGADLRRSEIIFDREQATAERLQQNRYLEQVIDTALLRRGG